MLAILAPGQGSQTPGFLAPWLDVPRFAERMEWLSTVAGLDLVRYGTSGSADEIRDTAVAQPLIVAAGLVSLSALFPHPAEGYAAVGVAAGHSVGEITAAAGAGVISAEAAMVFVRERGRAMAAASAAAPTGMTAILGGDRDEVLAKLAEHGLTAANDNGAGQIVAAGTRARLDAFAADGPGKARLIPLSVAGAFHTHHMGSAVDVLRNYSRSITVADPRTRLLSNADGAVVQSGAEILSRLVTQVANPVRWDLCTEALAEAGVTGIVELLPGGTLTGLAKRGLRGIESVALKTPDDLEKARALVAAHGGPNPLHRFPSADAPTSRLLIAPFSGTISVGDAPAGASLKPGSSVGAVCTRAGVEVAISAPHGGTVAEWLVADGEAVAPGQPLVRLHPEGAHA